MKVGKDPNKRNVQAYGHCRPPCRGDGVDRISEGTDIVKKTY